MNVYNVAVVYHVDYFLVSSCYCCENNFYLGAYYCMSSFKKISEINCVSVCLLHVSVFFTISAV